jgi:hypothetical protein
LQSKSVFLAPLISELLEGISKKPVAMEIDAPDKRGHGKANPPSVPWMKDLFFSL